ncbi:MAG: OST-HTH/LOTUS domain-containing protein, partial [Bacillota bacterium]|nr:OST-HTH/LOTUS domain-containing protein [Bacillota bacterium]
YLEVLASMASTPTEAASVKETQRQEEPKASMTSVDKLIEVIRTIITEVSDEDGWAFLGDLGNILNKRYPDFDTRNYGYTKLTPFVASLKRFEIRSTRTSNPSISLKHIRNKE